MAWTGAAVAALCFATAALVILGGSASGTETAPENTSPPTISPSSPLEGETVTATEGKWNGSPTSYSYAWYRCSGTGSCVSIPGATSATHVVGTADDGFALRVLVTAGNGGGSGAALSSAAPVTGPFTWYSCKEVGGTKGAFEDSACGHEVKGPFEWTKAPSGSAVGLQAVGSATFTIGWTQSGTTVSIGCSSQSGTGQLENPSSGGAGTVAGTILKFSGCTFIQPTGKGCKVTGGSFQTATLKATAAEARHPVALKFQPASGTSPFTVAVEGCSLTFLNGNHEFVGSFEGLDLPSTSSLQFTKTSSSELTTGGVSGLLEGTLKIETSPAHEALKLAP